MRANILKAKKSVDSVFQSEKMAEKVRKSQRWDSRRSAMCFCFKTSVSCDLVFSSSLDF